MILTITVKDERAKEWYGFWHIVPDTDDLPRFGFRIAIRSVEEDEGRVIRECEERMRWVKNILRGEEMATARRATQMVHDCKSHRAMATAIRGCTTRVLTPIRPKKQRLTAEQRFELQMEHFKELLRR